MPTVGISEYWDKWLEKIKASHIRKSKSEVVEEGLKLLQWRLDQDAAEVQIVTKRVKKEIAEQEEEGEIFE